MAKVPNSVTRGRAGVAARRLGAADAAGIYQLYVPSAADPPRPEGLDEEETRALYELARALWRGHDRHHGEYQYIKAFVRTYTRLRARKETP